MRFSLVSGLKVDGTYKVSTQKVKWNEWDIPRLDVMASPYHILLVSAITATLVIHGVKKRYRFKIIVKL